MSVRHGTDREVEAHFEEKDVPVWKDPNVESAGDDVPSWTPHHFKGDESCSTSQILGMFNVRYHGA